jgi:prepilin-type N-terminal cleavage/methylation domain-containing protein
MAMHQDGFSLVEMAVAMAVLGLLAWTVTSAYGNADAVRERDRARQEGEALREAMRAFALANARLPCPDSDGDGWEGDAAGNCAAAVESGQFPFRSVGRDLPEAGYRPAYAVYRAANDAVPALDADLAVAKERGSDVVGGRHYRDVIDLVLALGNAAATAAPGSHVRLTGDAAAAGAIDCAGNVRSTPAYFLVFPLRDRSGVGDRFDSVHGPGSNCAYAPATALAHDRDDVVVAEAADVLAGWLNARAY